MVKAPLDFAKLAQGSKSHKPLPSVCLVTGELVGPFRNGGLGTSMTGLAEFIAANGADVTVVYTGKVVGEIAEWKSHYLNAGIKLETLDDLGRATIVGPLSTIGWTTAWTLYTALRRRHFDVIHFNDTMGEGVYCFLGKRLGLAFAETLLTLALHSPTEWILESNVHLSNWAGFCCFTTAERLSIANTDLLWGPSRYLLDWVAGRDYVLPDQIYNQQYVIPTDDLFGAGTAKIKRAAAPVVPIPPRKPAEIVFFGRLEERKGIRLFTSAITRLGPELKKRGVSVVFMGKPGLVNGVQADEFIAARSGQWEFPWRMESGFGQREAVDYLRKTNCLAVMVSPVDNSPCTVYEALQFGLPFIAARTGGIPELIHADDHALHLFDYTVEALSASIVKILDNGISNARAAIPVAENQARWLGMHRDWRSFRKPGPGAAAARKWGVLIDHMGSAAELGATLASVRLAFEGALGSIVVLRREVAGIDAADAAGVAIVDELLDDTPADILVKLNSDNADALLMIRSGVTVAPVARPIFEQAAAGAADAYVPMTHVTDLDAVMPLLAGSAALSFLEGDFDAGGVVTKFERLQNRLGRDFAALDRTRIYLGVIEELYGVDGEVWPLPEALLTAASGQALIVPPLSEARRAMAYARSRRAERYQMLGIGRHAYRAVHPARAPSQPSSLQLTMASAVAAIPALQSLQAEATVRRILEKLLGYKAEGAKIWLKRWIGRG
jgi:glycosyltransferase involved in cell wall biosynthesis